MFNIKQARNNFYGFCATVPAVEFDGFMYVLDAAVSQYELTGSGKLEPCQKLIRVLTEFAYFDKENREVHIQLNFSELEIFKQALYDVMLQGFHPDTDHSFDKCLERPGVKMWTTRTQKQEE